MNDYPISTPDVLQLERDMESVIRRDPRLSGHLVETLNELRAARLQNEALRSQAAAMEADG